MKKHLALVLAVLVLAALSFAVTRCMIEKRCRPAPQAMEDVSFLIRKLNLTQDQAAQVRKFHDDYAARISECCSRHCEARARLGAALDSDPTQARGIVAEMARAYEDGELATLEHLRQMRAVFDPEQRKKFDRMLRSRVCGSCNMPGMAAGSSCN